MKLRYVIAGFLALGLSQVALADEPFTFHVLVMNNTPATLTKECKYCGGDQTIAPHKSIQFDYTVANPSKGHNIYYLSKDSSHGYFGCMDYIDVNNAAITKLEPHDAVGGHTNCLMQNLGSAQSPFIYITVGCKANSKDPTGKCGL